MNYVATNRVKNYTFAAVLSGVLAMPLVANADTDTKKTGANNAQSTEQMFNTLDTDRSGVISEAEYIVHAQAAKNIQADAATNEFNTMDANDDGRLTLAELKTGADAYKRTVQ